MQNYLVEKDLQGISSRGYKVAFVMPQMNGEQLNKCVTYYRNIYKNLSSSGHNAFDPIEQVVNKRIGKQAYTFLLVRDYDEQDELLTYIPEFSASFARLSNTGEADMLKVMPDGQIIDANLMPLCHIKQISDYDKTKLQAVIRNKMNGVENFQFVYVDEGRSGVKIYYQKKRDSIYLHEEERKSYREYRRMRSMRIFYDETLPVFGELMYLGKNVEFFDELGGPIETTKLFSFRRREAVKNMEARSSVQNEFEDADFNQIECPEGYKVLALKKATQNCEFMYIPRIVDRAFCRVHAYDCSVKVQPSLVGDEEVIAIFCKDKSYKFMNNWTSMIYACLLESPFYKNDKTAFYYRDARGKVLPINYAHVCKVDSCHVYSENKLKSVLEHQIGSGFNIDIRRDDKGDYECYAVVDGYAFGKAKAKSNLEEGKHCAVREASKMFGENAITPQANDGSIIGQEKDTEMSR